ncbi:hypothetical protein WR25_10028 [Diploscapter pachys]|uniref:Presenilin n=1 Tax=Diploscapter pachys TaxID=2018661 RepID=A0A2A2KDW2_9BILA|nr:hypothetical protein WR25_10028 [Diploscapter pachys]
MLPEMAGILCLFKDLRGVILPVLFNICLTLFSWIKVYEMKTDMRIVPAYYFDTNSSLTTGSMLLDGLLNGLTSTVLIATVSFGMLALALYDFRRLVQFWLSFTCITILYAMSGSFFYDALRAFTTLSTEICIAAASALCFFYGTVGVYAFFFSAPNGLHQFYVCCNCSFISLFYLRSFPGETAWFVLGCVVLWDVFAVLNFYGPLRKVQEKAGDYSANVLRFLMFSDNRGEDRMGAAGDEREVKIMQDGSEIEEDESSMDDTNDTTSSSSNSSFVDDEDTDSVGIEEEEVLACDELEPSANKPDEEMTVADALQDSTMRLGLGDFVFYSLLVGKAATSGSSLATLASIVGVLYGLVITLTSSSFGEVTTPALPLSVLFGAMFHFVTLVIVRANEFYTEHAVNITSIFERTEL